MVHVHYGAALGYYQISLLFNRGHCINTIRWITYTICEMFSYDHLVLMINGISADNVGLHLLSRLKRAEKVNILIHSALLPIVGNWAYHR